MRMGEKEKEKEEQKGREGARERKSVSEEGQRKRWKEGGHNENQTIKKEDRES